MIIAIKNYDIGTVKQSLIYLLEKSLHDENIRIIATNTVVGKPDQISAIYDFMKENSFYVADPDEVELFISPIRLARDYNMGKKILGDCDDLSLFTTALFRSIGIESKIVIIDKDNTGFDHVYSLAKAPSGKWVSVDLASKFPLGWEPSYYQKIIIE